MFASNKAGKRCQSGKRILASPLIKNVFFFIRLKDRLGEDKIF